MPQKQVKATAKARTRKTKVLPPTRTHQHPLLPIINAIKIKNVRNDDDKKDKDQYGTVEQTSDDTTKEKGQKNKRTTNNERKKERDKQCRMTMMMRRVM